MSAVNDNLILHLDFDEVEGGKVEDLSAFDHDATVNGSAALVPDDLLGSCLSFDGNDDYVSLPDLSGDYANGLTIEAWVFYSSFNNWSRIIELGNGPSSDNIVFANTGASKNLALQVFRGGAGTSVEAVGALRANEWLHVAATVGRDGSATLYVNAAAVKTAALQLPQKVARSNNYIGKSNWPGDALFSGKIASVRVYSRALSADEIRPDMEEDRTAAAAFRAAHPLDFGLYDEDDHPVLYITNDAADHKLNLEITNSSRQAIRLVTPNGAAPDASHNNFELRFRPGTLASTSFDRVAIAESGWRLGKARRADGSVSLYLSGADGTAINPTEKIKLTLLNVSADPGDGARGTRVELKYGQLRYAGDATAVAGTRVQHLSVVNHAGQKNVPLHVGFAGSNTILNDGRTTNTLKLRITNTLASAAIPLKPGDGSTSSKFVVSFDVQGDNEKKEWALGSKSEVQAIEIEPGNAAWSVRKKTEGISTEWIITAQNRAEMAAGEAVELTISNIITELPSGFTNLYVHYEHLPGYWDGQFVAPIEKGPITYRQGNVGVGTTTPAVNLHVTSGGNVPLRIESTSNVGTWLGLKNTTVGGGTWNIISTGVNNGEGAGGLLFKQGDGGTVHMMIDSAGNVGVGTITPQAKLSVRGGVHVGSEADPGAGNLVVDGVIGLSGSTNRNFIKKNVAYDFPEEPFKMPTGGGHHRWNGNLEGACIFGWDGGVLGTTSGGEKITLKWDASGNVRVRGYIAAQVKYFRIDHPVKADHLLVHACLEGPESGVYYRGAGRLADGEATVKLPAYFEALTLKQDRTVTLTAKGREPYLLSYEEIRDGEFKVYGTKADGEFCWEVKAVRADVEHLQVEVRR